MRECGYGSWLWIEMNEERASFKPVSSGEQRASVGAARAFVELLKERVVLREGIKSEGRERREKSRRRKGVELVRKQTDER